MNSKNHNRHLIQVSLLNITHIQLILKRLNSETNIRLESLLLTNLIGRIELFLNDFLPNRNALGVIAVENNELIGLINLIPVNKRGTCWFISEPLIIRDSLTQTSHAIKILLIRNAVQLTSERSKGWLIKHSTSDSQSISTSRSAGFQPLKVFKIWSNNRTKCFEDSSKLLTLGDYDYLWQNISKTNINDIWRLDNSAESVITRQILDRKPSDLLSSQTNICGSLSAINGINSSPLFAILNQIPNTENTVFRIARDVAWDNRLVKLLPKIINQRFMKINNLSFEVSSEDQKLNQLMQDMGFNLISEKVLLGKSLWKKSQYKKLIDANTIDSMMSNLNPQNPPLPSPLLKKYRL